MSRLTAGQLCRAGREVAAPFELEVIQGGAAGVLEVVALLRLLPGRRLVARVRAAAGGDQSLLKLFFGAGARRYCARERRGLECLAACGVATPRLLGEVGTTDGAAVGLLTEWLEGAAPVTAADPAAFLEIAAGLGRLHLGRAIQHDPHLHNYLKRPDGSVFAIDGDGVRPVRGPLSRRRALDNLGLLLAQLPPAGDGILADACAAYSQARWQRPADQSFVARVERHLVRRRRLRTRRYLAKTLRDCSEFRCSRGGGTLAVALRSHWDDAMAAFAADPESVFEGAQVLKAGNSATVVRALIGGPCIVKRYNVKGFGHGLRRALRPLPRYRNAWRNGHRLHFMGLPTARPIALIERRLRPLAKVAYLVMEDCGDTDLADLAASGDLSPGLMMQVADLFRQLATLGLTHGDTKASNFLVHSGEVCLIDLDAMRESARGQHRDVARFLANWDAAPEIRTAFARALQAAGVSL